ncbi:kinesin light chain [Pyrenophora seminiperda CCB06]|uniref:Kinesin light chain n=1 Tax=Pyrenophora seminiperda CCB06 TaxID=1302712 RepID=A0A3M7MF90_9PLEO|nr:kinesin light chain [Pyrenophora seminiperda CCB06]
MARKLQGGMAQDAPCAQHPLSLVVGMHCLGRQPSQKPSVNFLCLLHSTIKVLRASPLLGMSKPQTPMQLLHYNALGTPVLTHSSGEAIPPYAHSFAQMEQLRDAFRRHIK